MLATSKDCTAEITTGRADFLKGSWGNFDILAEHWYAQGGHHWDIEKGKNLKYDEPSDNAYVKDRYDAA
jgi:hypothetical protein